MKKMLRILSVTLLSLGIVLGPFGMFEQKVEAATTTWNFSYTGAEQTWSAPVSGTYSLVVWGAEGGSTSYGSGGKGGYSVGQKSLTAGQTLYIYVGGQGFINVSSGGWNGGGKGDTRRAGYDANGGGATDIRIGGTTLNNRIIVAGGGGGAGYYDNGGNGGGASGLNGNDSVVRNQGGGATQSAGGAAGYYGYSGSFGTGGAGIYDSGDAGGGGGGWYGGGGGNGGGGGSGYVGGVTSGSTNSSSRTGDGYATITLISTTPPTGSIIINKKADGTGATFANSSPLTVSPSATSNLSSPSSMKMFISYSSTTPTATTAATAGVSSGWVPYDTTYSWPYTGVDGNLPVYVWFKDELNEISARYSDSITFDSTPVVGTISINANPSTIFKYNASSQLDFSTGSSIDPVNSVTITSGGSVQLNGTTSGTYISPALDISSVGKVGTSVIEWRDIVPTGTTLSVETRCSLPGSNGTSWTSWAAATKNQTIQGLPSGTDLTGIWLQYRVRMTTSNSSITPSVDNVIINIVPPSTTTSEKDQQVTLTFTKAPIYADVNQVVVSNYSDFSTSETYNYGTDLQNDSLQWTIGEVVDGQKTVYAKYIDWAGNTSSVFSTSTMFDTTPPNGTISINGGAASTNQSTVALSISATDDASSAADMQMLISNDQNFAGTIWEPLAASKDWPLDSATSGTKTIYIRFKDGVGNISDPISASINYTASSGTGGTGSQIINNYITYAFTSAVEHYQVVQLTGKTLYCTGPATATEALTLSELTNLKSLNKYINNDVVNYRLTFDITPENAASIEDMTVTLDFNNLNEDGIKLQLLGVKLLKYFDSKGDYDVIKTQNMLSVTPKGNNIYVIGLGNDNSGVPIIKANFGGEFALDYKAVILTTPAPGQDNVNPIDVVNHATLKVYTGAGGYTEFVEPDRPGKQFDIVTKISRWVGGVS